MPQQASSPPGVLPFDSSTRLHRLQGAGELSELLVESWACRDALSEPFELEIHALGTQAGLDIHALLGERVTLQTVLADGSLLPRSGLVFNASAEEADGGFARYGLVVRPRRESCGRP